MELNDSVGVPSEMSLPLALSKYFGKLPGETMVEFAAEIRALTPKDKTDFVEMFASIGYVITPSK